MYDESWPRVNQSCRRTDRLSGQVQTHGPGWPTTGPEFCCRRQYHSRISFNSVIPISGVYGSTSRYDKKTLTGIRGFGDYYGDRLKSHRSTNQGRLSTRLECTCLELSPHRPAPPTIQLSRPSSHPYSPLLALQQLDKSPSV